MIQQIARLVDEIKAYFDDKEQASTRIVYFARLSIVMNAVIGIGKIVMGYASHSGLFVASGFYNISLSIANILAIKGYGKSKGQEIWPFTLPDNKDHLLKNQRSEYHYYQLVGVIVFLAGLAYTIASVSILFDGYTRSHFSTLVVTGIGVAVAVEIIISLQGILMWRREKEPLLEAIKLTSFISSLIGLVLVQAAILGHSESNPSVYFDYVGILLGAASSCVGIYMVAFAGMRIRTANRADKPVH
jgi:divalent metal cation (Fe/Co/Zn/Cd) transporter